MSAQRLQEDWPYAAVMIETIRENKDLTPSAVQLFIEVYSEFTSPRTQAQLVKATGISRRMMIRATKQLVSRGLVRYEKERLWPVNLIKGL